MERRDYIMRMIREQGEPATVTVRSSMVESSSHKRVAVGSTPAGRTGGAVQGEPVLRFARVRSNGEMPGFHPGEIGSIPIARTRKEI